MTNYDIEIFWTRANNKRENQAHNYITTSTCNQVKIKALGDQI